MTTAEVRLWARLKRMRADGFHFRRQAPFRGYFLDFVRFSRKLVIELDGWRHAEVSRPIAITIETPYFDAKASRCSGSGTMRSTGTSMG